MFFESKLPRYFITLEIITLRAAKGTKNLVIFETTLIVRDIDSLNPPILHFIQTHSCKDVHEFSTQERKKKINNNSNSNDNNNNSSSKM